MHYDHRSCLGVAFPESPVELLNYGFPPSSTASMVILSLAGALFRFNLLMAALTLVGRMGEGGVFVVLSMD